MRLKNFTDIPNETIREIYRLVVPSGISNYDITIKNHDGIGACGTAYSMGSAWHGKARPFVNVRIAPEKKFRRYTSPGGNGYIPIPIGSRLEAVVVVLAHELRHLWQSTHSRGMVWGARGKMSERDADAYAIHKLREYRRVAPPNHRNGAKLTDNSPSTIFAFSNMQS